MSTFFECRGEGCSTFISRALDGHVTVTDRDPGTAMSLGYASEAAVAQSCEDVHSAMLKKAADPTEHRSNLDRLELFQQGECPLAFVGRTAASSLNVGVK